VITLYHEVTAKEVVVDTQKTVKYQTYATAKSNTRSQASGK
jgi:hypothetical protein